MITQEELAILHEKTRKAAKERKQRWIKTAPIEELRSELEKLIKDQESLTQQRDNYEIAYKEEEKEKLRFMKQCHDLKYTLDHIEAIQECSKCADTLKQYNLIRTAFDRKKNDHKAITTFLTKHQIQLEGKPLSLTKIIKLGNHLQKTNESK